MSSSCKALHEHNNINGYLTHTAAVSGTRACNVREGMHVNLKETYWRLIVPSADHYNPGQVSVVDEASPSFMQYTGKYPNITFRLLLMPRHMNYT
jgi:hypothetical protein